MARCTGKNDPIGVVDAYEASEPGKLEHERGVTRIDAARRAEFSQVARRDHIYPERARAFAPVVHASR